MEAHDIIALHVWFFARALQQRVTRDQRAQPLRRVPHKYAALRALRSRNAVVLETYLWSEALIVLSVLFCFLRKTKDRLRPPVDSFFVFAVFGKNGKWQSARNNNDGTFYSLCFAYQHNILEKGSARQSLST